MTVKDALRALVALPVSDDLLEKAIVDNDLDGAEMYTKDKAGDLDVAAVDVLSAMINAPNISEGGYSVTFKDNAEKRIVYISTKSGSGGGSNPKLNEMVAALGLTPSVKGASVW